MVDGHSDLIEPAERTMGREVSLCVFLSTREKIRTSQHRMCDIIVGKLNKGLHSEYILYCIIQHNAYIIDIFKRTAAVVMRDDLLVSGENNIID